MNRKNKILLTLSILLLAVVVALLWTVQSFSLNASVCSAPIPAETTDPLEGEVALSAVQMYPTYRIPITFTSVEVRDTVTKEPVHLLMASSWVGTREDFEKEFSEGPHLSAEGGKLTSKNIVLGTLWSHWPEWDHPTEYVFHYKLYGIFPKTEHLAYDWA